MSLNIYPELPLWNLSWQRFVLVPAGSRNVFPAVCDVPLCIFEVRVMCSLGHLIPRLNPEFLWSFCKTRPLPAAGGSLSPSGLISPKMWYPAAFVPSWGPVTAFHLCFLCPSGMFALFTAARHRLFDPLHLDLYQRRALPASRFPSCLFTPDCSHLNAAPRTHPCGPHPTPRWAFLPFPLVFWGA